MLMTYAEFKRRFRYVQEELPKIFLNVRNENVQELKKVMDAGDQQRIAEVQRRMNDEAQRRIAALSEQEGIPIEFGDIEFNASVDFNIEVNIAGHFFEELPDGTAYPA